MSYELRVKKTQLLIVLSSCFMFFISADSFASSITKGIKDGNRLYDQKKYEEAIEKYNEAKEESPDSDVLNFNLGAAQYKNGNYPDAVDSFTKALNTDSKEIEAKAVYNIANSKYKLGSQNADSDMESAIKLYKESLDYYKRSVGLDENNGDAKYNHELVERELKVLLDRQKQQQQQQQQEDEDQKGEDQKEQKQDGEDNREKQDAQQKQESQSGQDEKEQQAESESRQDGQQGEEDPADEQQGGSPVEETEEMSPEEAHMLLETFGEDEAREGEKKKGKGYYPGVLKDW
jgi:Ca-activated chloride channel family protein